MSLKMVAALVRKDVYLFFKNRFFALISGLGLVAYAGIYFALPAAVDESLALGWHGPALPPSTAAELQEGGLRLIAYDTAEALKAAVLADEQPVGVALPPEFWQQLAAGDRPRAVIYFQSNLPDEYRAAYQLLLAELGYQLAGQPLLIEADEAVIGPDMAGQQVPPRERALPMLAVFVLMFETWGLAALIAAEAEAGTLRALLATPLTVAGLYVSKGATGVLMAFGQVLVLLLITGGLRHQPLLLLAALLLGAFLVTGVSFLIASVARDMMSVMAWGMLALIALAIPGFNILLPGLASGWIRVIPSYYLVDAIYRVMNFGAGWEDINGSLLMLAAVSLAFFGFGLLALGRKLR
jgi:ABC-2 type transport system permease protein